MHEKKMTAAEQQQAKEAVAKAVVDRIEQLWSAEFALSGRELRLGLGTGSTVEPALHQLGARIQEGRIANLCGMPTSDRTGQLATNYGIRVLTPDEENPLHFGFDGADFIDGELLENQHLAHTIKGGGAAHVVERDVALRCERWVIIADQSKIVRTLNENHWIPVEVPRNNVESLQRALEEMGAVKVALRESSPEISRKPCADNGNPIVEAHFKAVDNTLLQKLNGLEQTLGAKHGLFFDMADEVIIAAADGSIRSYSCTRARH